MSGAVSLFPHTPSWLKRGRLYLLGPLRARGKYMVRAFVFLPVTEWKIKGLILFFNILYNKEFSVLFQRKKFW